MPLGWAPRRTALEGPTTRATPGFAAETCALAARGCALDRSSSCRSDARLSAAYRSGRERRAATVLFKRGRDATDIALRKGHKVGVKSLNIDPREEFLTSASCAGSVCGRSRGCRGRDRAARAAQG